MTMNPDAGPATIKMADGSKRNAKAAERAAYRAYRKFRTMAPLLTEYASDTLGYKVQVVSGAENKTDGKIITIRPPFELSKFVRHMNCASGTCEACDQQERVMAILHHEMSHILHGSFQKFRYTYTEFNELTRRMPKLKEKFGEGNWFPMNRYDVTYEDETAMYIAVSVYIPLALVLSAVEDLRINEQTFKTHPHLRDLEMKFHKEIIEQGIVKPTGEAKQWKEFDQNFQMVAALIMGQYGVDCTGKLDDKVLEDYRASGVEAIVWDAVSGQNVWDSLKLSADIVNALVDYGYFWSLPGSMIQDIIDMLKMLTGHGIEGEPDVGAGGGGFSVPGTRDNRFDGETGQKRDGEEKKEEDAAKDPDTGDKYTESQYWKAYNEVIEGAKAFDGVPMNVSGVHEYIVGEGQAWGYPSVVMEADTAARNKAVNKARLVFEENARVEHHRNQRGGKLNGRVLGKRAAVGDDRLFAKKVTPDTRTYEVMIGLDISGSTRNGALSVITATAQAMADVCHRAGINFEILAHTGERNTNPASNATYEVNIYKVKSLEDRWDSKAKETLSRLRGGGANFDGHTMQYYRKRLDASNCTDKIMFYFTDGAMPGMNRVNEQPILERELRLCKQRGYHVVGVGVGTDSPKEYGMDTVIVQGPNDIGAVLDRLSTKFKKS